MSRDLTPKQLDIMIKENNLPNLTDTMTITFNGVTKPAYSDEQKDISHKYKRLGRFGFDFLMCCKNNGLLSSEDGQNIIQQIEDHFNNKEINKDLATQVDLWYNGEFSPGYYMDDNNSEFASYLKQLIEHKDE